MGMTREKCAEHVVSVPDNQHRAAAHTVLLCAVPHTGQQPTAALRPRVRVQGSAVAISFPRPFSNDTEEAL